MYKHLDQQLRYQIYVLRRKGSTQKEIANLLDVHPSTICREIARNRGKKGYWPIQAHQKATIRKSKANRSNARKCNPSLRVVVFSKISKDKWSPKQISESIRRGFIPEAQGLGTISSETIYKWVMEDKLSGGSVFTGLRRKKKKYNRRLKPNAGRGFIPGRRDIEDRPQHIENRQEFGHWEADTVIGTQAKGEVIVTVVERKSRKVLAGKASSKSSEDVTKTLLKLLDPVKDSVKTITFDNGKEFAKHSFIDEILGCTSYFAKPYHSWERGSNEHFNGLLRQFIPKGVPIENFSDDLIEEAIELINTRPMALHDFLCADTIFEKERLALNL